ncbi:MAG: DUF4179 domain-containing protein [Ruminiclostridium sp.]|nr:DUF4179 domain-containing protein [Ruminiclostridium sp.]
MKDYRETMKDLSFTQEQKEAMVDRLLAESPQTVTHRPRKRLLVAAAALLALTITACAAGGFQALAQVIANIIDPNADQAQTQIIEELFTPIGVSDTHNGVTITAEGVMGDTHSVSILYSITRDNGDPLIPPSEETARVSNGDNTLLFEANDTALNMVEFPEDTFSGTFGYGGSNFLDFDVSDTTLYFLESWTYPLSPIQLKETVHVTFVNLYSHEMFVTLQGDWVENQIPLVRGTWDLTFDLNYEPSALALPTGQTFHHQEATGTITALRISPLSFHLEYDYTMDMESLADRYDPATAYPPGEDLEYWAIIDLLTDSAMYLSLNFTDGSSTPLFLDGDISQEGHAIVSDTFETIYPLDTIESITIGDLTIPVEAP